MFIFELLQMVLSLKDLVQHNEKNIGNISGYKIVVFVSYLYYPERNRSYSITFHI